MNWKNIIKAEWEEHQPWREDEGKHKYDYPFSFSLFTEAEWLSQDWIDNLEKFMGEYPIWLEKVIDNITEWSNKMMKDVKDNYKDSEAPANVSLDEDEETRRERRRHKTGSISQNKEKMLKLYSGIMEVIFGKSINAAKYNVDNMKDADKDDFEVDPSEPLDPEIIGLVGRLIGGDKIKQPIEGIIEEVAEKQELDISEESKEAIIRETIKSENISTIQAYIFIVTQFKFIYELPRRQAEMTEYGDEGEDAHVGEFEDRDEFDPDFTDKYTSSNWWKYIRNGVW